ncbi:MAG: uracil-DNA glycosylase [Bacilli bacterium]|jgi:uracil-DNA glycosylase|nr:uracil-DNA glycosylase [Clostridium sp.]MDY3798324.1 uracil-DNA glycosylase [Bacilli bacterium]CDE96145.1 uracil-DNA glycosylase [Clostridium sp. CAG:914]
MTNNYWDAVLKEEYEKNYFKNIAMFINKEYKEKIVYPPKRDILRALKLTDYNDVKVVILGQDPYHGENEANGLSFSVNEGIKLPPSLKNIYKELYDDLGITKTTGDLTSWANQGVLLLNSVLTVLKDTPTSHSKIGWQEYTDAIIRKLNEREKTIVFILWGNYARSKKNLITNKRHYIIESPHPSPFSANSGFFGSRPFSKTNEFLKKNNIKEIEW